MFDKKAYMKIYHKKWYEENRNNPKYKELILESRRKYKQNHREQNRIYMKTYNKEYGIKNKDKLLEQKKEYRVENRNKLSKQKKEYHNRSEIKIYYNLRNRERRRIDLNYKILCALRIRICMTIAKGYKSAKTLELLGCSVDFFKKYLESKFEGGISWSNYGLYGWHLDHVVPCSSFDLTQPEEQRRCFHYTNLQPLWAKKNLSKGSKSLESFQSALRMG